MERISGEVAAATKKSMVANLFAKEGEKRRQSASEKLENNLRKHYSNTVSTSRTPPRRGHHGNTHG